MLRMYAIAIPVAFLVYMFGALSMTDGTDRTTTVYLLVLIVLAAPILLNLLAGMFGSRD